ncbi:MAG TPA: (Fe-S)-binding protein [Candidatus Limnocylindria bacterium]|nr:(Fe-S)-binding protein [Candidatus Limnocylindria bacterium]
MVAPTPGLWAVVLLILTLAAFGAFAWRTVRLYRLLRLGRDESRLDHGWRRVRDELVIYLGQRKLLKRPYYVRGLGHALIFWGFLVITWGSADLLLRGILGWHMPFTDTAAYAWMLDVFAVAVFVSVVVAWIRRALIRPPRMHIATEGYVILALIGFLMLTLLTFESAAEAMPRVPSRGDLLEPRPPVASALAPLIPTAAGAAIFAGAWWAHVVTVLAFAVYLPRTKHLHIVTTLPNVFFRKQTPRGQLSLVEDIENKETFGAATIRDFSWKQLLDGYTCTECGRCSDACPALATGKPLDPQKIVLDIRNQLLAEGPKLLADPKAETTAPAHWVDTKPEELWACTTCAACVEACPVTIEHIDKIVDMRRYLALMEGSMPPEAQRSMTNIERAGNPWGEPRASRGDWAQGLEIPTFAERPDAEYLYFVGCAASYDRRNQKVARALATILRAAGVSFAILGAAETCNGDPARRLGNEYLFQLQARQNIETMNATAVKKVITSCPHCFNTIANEYPQLGGSYEVVHALPFVQKLITEKRITLRDGVADVVAYHDPCYLGRHNGIYDEPRAVLDAIPGVERREIAPHHRERGFCCGAGGGRMWMEEKMGQRVNHRRVEQLVMADTGATKVASGCPYCLIMLDEGVGAKGIQAQVKPVDVLELVAARLVEATPSAAQGG